MSTSSDRRRGFNAAKKGSGQVGFQTAPPAAPPVPTAADWIEPVLPLELDTTESDLPGTYDIYQEMLARGDGATLGLSDEEADLVRLAQQQANSTKVLTSADPNQTAHRMAILFGHEKTDADAVLAEVQEEIAPGSIDNGHTYRDPHEVAAHVHELLHGPPFLCTPTEDTKKLVEDIAEGRVLLSDEDVAGLTVFRDRLHAKQERENSLEALQPLDADWIPSVCQRRCTLCGQFIGARTEHVEDGTCASSEETKRLGLEIEKASLFRRVGRTLSNAAIYGPSSKRMSDNFGTRMSRLLEDDELAFPLPEGQSADFLDLRESRMPAMSDEQTEDLYMAHPFVREQLLLARMEPRSLWDRTRVMRLPSGLRDAIVENPPEKDMQRRPPRAPLLTAVAARIEPPLADHEIKRIIDVGGARSAMALLRSTRTKEAATRVLADYATPTTRHIALDPDLPVDVIREMASSGNPEARLQAAISPSTPEDVLIQLARDPDIRVRQALASGPDDLVPRFEEARARAALSPRHTAYDPYGFYDAYGTIRPVSDLVHQWVPAASRSRAVAEVLVNDPDDSIAIAVFSKARSNSTSGFSSTQKFVISKVASRERFNALKRHVMHEKYSLSDPDVIRFLAH